MQDIPALSRLVAKAFITATTNHNHGEMVLARMSILNIMTAYCKSRWLLLTMNRKEGNNTCTISLSFGRDIVYMLTKARILWIISSIISAVFLFGTGSIIYHSANDYTPDKTQLTSYEEVSHFLENNQVAVTIKSKKPILVPTGLFINSIYFESPYNVHISGYIWQKYDKSGMEIEHKGIEFPEGIKIKLTESYRTFDNGVLTIGWHFEGQFIQNFNYFKFPIDNKTAQVRLWHMEDYNNVILVPDLASYESTNYADKFGIDSDIVASGYTILDTFFNFKKSHYNTNFGLTNSAEKKDQYDLYFNIVLKRSVINSAIVYFLPLTTIIVLMFFGILLLTTRPEHLTFLGYSLIRLLSLAAFLLFIVVMSHIQLRSRVTAESVIYLEYIYMIIYVAIIYSIGVAFTIDHASQLGFKRIFANDGLWAKLSFMPLITLAFFLATFFSF